MNRAWILVSHPEGALTDALRLDHVAVPPLGDGEVLIRAHYLSVDPGQRTWMRKEGSYMSPLIPGAPMPGGVLGRVLESRAAGFNSGDMVSGMGQWADHCVVHGKKLRHIQDDPALPPLAQMSVLGATGWTAYLGLINVGRPKLGDSLVVSAAAGAVGSIVGQIGRIKGCRVIGIAGSPEKCAWLVEELGFDAAINYRTENVAARIDALCPKGVDIYFENVGGAVGATIYPRMAAHGRIVLCGLLSTYTDGGASSRIDLGDMLMKRVRVEAFVVTDHFDLIGEATTSISAWLRNGSLRYNVDVVDGLENSVTALESLLQPGDAHRGKLMVRVASVAEQMEAGGAEQ